MNDKSKNRYINIAKSYSEYYGQSSPTLKTMREVEFSIIDKILDSNSNILNVLDAGCGTGLHTFYVAEKGKSVIGVDKTEEMVQECEKKRLQSILHEKNTLFFVGNLENLQFENNSFDLVICLFGGFYHSENYNQICNEFYRVLRPNGICIVSVLNRWRLLRLTNSVLRGKYKWFKDAIFNNHSVLMDENCREISNSFTIYFSQQQLKLVFQKTGFKLVHSIGRFSLITPIYEANREASIKSFIWNRLCVLDNKIMHSSFANTFGDLIIGTYKKIE